MTKTLSWGSREPHFLGTSCAKKKARLVSQKSFSFFTGTGSVPPNPNVFHDIPLTFFHIFICHLARNIIFNVIIIIFKVIIIIFNVIDVIDNMDLLLTCTIQIQDDTDVDIRTDGNDNGNVNPKSNHPNNNTTSNGPNAVLRTFKQYYFVGRSTLC